MTGMDRIRVLRLLDDGNQEYTMRELVNEGIVDALKPLVPDIDAAIDDCLMWGDGSGQAYGVLVYDERTGHN